MCVDPDSMGQIEGFSSTQPAVIRTYRHGGSLSPAVLDAASGHNLTDSAASSNNSYSRGCIMGISPFLKMIVNLKGPALKTLIEELGANGSLSTVLKIPEITVALRSKCYDYGLFGNPVLPQENKAFMELAVETIQQILGYLENMNDLAAARKVSRSWYFSSMDENLLHLNLKTAGWTLDETIDRDSRHPGFLSQLSRRLQMEVDLSPCSKMLPSLPLLDITDLSNNSNGSSSNGFIKMTISNCQRYMMLFEGYYIYVYRLLADHIALQWSIMCPRRGINASMDTTYNRMAIAVLLEGRMGIVFDLINGRLTSIYRNLGVEDDHPISVAIGPQRRCVAFGCRTGIELHWVDVHSCQNQVNHQEIRSYLAICRPLYIDYHYQNRWFPLSAPSDFLYFLPAREGVDPVRKLRLISSSSMPSFRSPDSNDSNTSSSSLRALFWGNADPRLQNDHYQAVPISDGTFVLFTDPITKKLCLGSDAPLGEPFKLVRKVIFMGPELPGNDGMPRIYASAPDLRRGLRVVCAYGDNLWLFTVPPDLLDDLYPLKMTAITEGVRRRNEAPCRIKGRYVGNVPDLVSVCISTKDGSKNGSLFIRGLSSNGTIWTYGAPSVSFVRTSRRIIDRDGSMQVVQDGGSPGSGHGRKLFLGDGPPREWQLDGLDEYLNGTMMVTSGAMLYTVPGSGMWSTVDDINICRYVNNDQAWDGTGSGSTDGTLDEHAILCNSHPQNKFFPPPMLPRRFHVGTADEPEGESAQTAIQESAGHTLKLYILPCMCELECYALSYPDLVLGLILDDGMESCNALLSYYGKFY